MKPQFIGTGRPQITLRGAGFGSPPEFEPGSTHTARCVLVNPTDSVWAYRGEVYLDGRIAASGIVEFTIEAQAERTVDFPIVMPGAGSYQAFLDVSVDEELILHHPFEELVEIATAPPVEPPELAYFYVAILYQMLGRVEWHNYWLRLSEGILGVVPAGTAEHPIRVNQFSYFMGAAKHPGSVPIRLAIYKDGALINSWSRTATFQWYIGPQQFRATDDWFPLGGPGTQPGRYQLVATTTIFGQEITRTYDYIVQ